MKGSAVYNRRYPSFFRLLRGNPSIENNLISTKKRNLYRGWLCRPLIVFCVTVFPSARARHSVSLGRVAHFVTARAFTLSVPSCRKSALGRGAVAPLKVRSPKSAVFGGGYLHFFISLQRLLSLKCVSWFLRTCASSALLTHGSARGQASPKVTLGICRALLHFFIFSQLFLTLKHKIFLRNLMG